MRKLFRIVLSLLVFTFLFFSFSNLAAIRNLILRTGLIKEEVYIAGTGSMYPTFPKGEGESDIVRASETVAWPKMKSYPQGLEIFGIRFFGYKLQRGDIVSFSNAKTRQITLSQYGQVSGFVKRVIALPGDNIEIRDGYVKVNNRIVDEPYTAKPRSTYGGEFLSDCRLLKIPAGKLLVMGDNRKGSLDSRHALEFVSYSDIDHVMPISQQQDFQSKWRETKADLKNAGKPSLDVQLYLSLLNKKRTQAGKKPLAFNDKLAKSAEIRGKIILQYNDLSFEATKSGYTMEKALREVGYQNIVKGEAPVMGFYDAEELIENFFAFPNTKKFLLDKDFQETGVTVLVGEINNCPVQIIVQHLAGYVPPNYQKEDVGSWRKLKSQLEEILPSWEKAREYQDYYAKNKDQLERLIAIIKERINHAERILNRMEKNQWLSEEEQEFVKKEPELNREQERLARELNEQ